MTTEDINDFYKFYVSSEMPISIVVAGTVTSDLNLYIYNVDQLLLSSHTSSSSIEEYSSVLPTGWYVVKLVLKRPRFSSIIILFHRVIGMEGQLPIKLDALLMTY